MGEEVEQVSAPEVVVKEAERVRDNSAPQVIQRALAIVSLVLFLAAGMVPDQTVAFFLALIGFAASAAGVFAFVKPRAFFPLAIVTLVLNAAVVAYAIATFYGLTPDLPIQLHK